MNSQKKTKISLCKKAAAFLVVMCMMIGVILPLITIDVSAAAPTSYTTITTNSTASVSIASSGGAEYFKFVPTHSGTYKFYSTNYTGDPYGALLDASGSTLISNDDNGSYNFSFTYDCTANTTYYVKAYMYGSKTGSYTLNVETVSIDCEHSYVLQSTTVADCENDGVEIYVCSLCGNTYTNLLTPALGHNFAGGACVRCGSVDYANATCISITTAGGTNYPLFNSGRTGIGSNTSGELYTDALNPAPTTYTNNGYDVYVRANTNNSSCSSQSQIGLSFVINTDVSEISTLSIYAYDVDEESGELDGIYLVNDTTGVETRLGTLSGMDEDWFNTSFSIPPSLLLRGNKYHIKVEGEVDTWCVYIRTANLIINGASESPINPITGIENADLSASISSSGLVSVGLTANAYAAETYTLEYKAVCAADNAQYGGKEYSVTIPTTSTEFDTTFQLESGAPRGTYEITVFIKDSAGTVIATRTATASYGYSAVSYNSNGGSQNLPTDGTTYSSGDTVTVKFDYVPSMYGYTFLGWSTDRNATEPMYTENGTNTFTIGASDVTLYAVWGLDVCSHEWTETSRIDATCTTDGSLEETCSDCGATRTTPIPKLGHDYVSGVCSRCGAAEPSADVWDGSIDTSWYNSTDTEFTIYTAEQLAGLAQLVNNGNTFSGKTIYLGNNIDLDNREWTPIGISNTEIYMGGTGISSYYFSGKFDGRFFKIYNARMTYTVSGSSLIGVGLFGNVYNAELSNLGVVGYNYDVSGGRTGGLCGLLTNSTVSNCFATGVLNFTFLHINGGESFGGLIGDIRCDSNVSNCYATCELTTSSQDSELLSVGGLVGFICYEGTKTIITNCYANSTIISSSANANGGLVGELFCGTLYIQNCFSDSTINASHTNAILGNRDYLFSSSLTITNSYFTNGGNDSFGGYATETDNFQSQSWIEANLGWNFDTVWEFRAGNDYPVLQGFGEGGGNTPHTHTFEETSRTEPTCTVDGRINYACSCGDTRVELIPALGHNIQTTIETEATCTTDGLIVDRCVNGGCDYEKRTVIHGEHDYSITDRQDATCDTPGYVEYTCSKCGDKHYEHIEGRHNYVESSRIEPQVGVEGSIVYTCTECGDSYSVTIPALNPVLKNSAVLLIQNSLPWAEDVNISLLEALKDRGVVSSYNIINTSALASFDLAQYGVVFIANDQTTAMYDDLAANAEKLENYVRAGGNLIYGACDEGWGGEGSLTHSLPGGVATSNYYSVHNYIVNALHPVVTGVNTDNRSLRDELLKGNYCSHTYFDIATLPAGADIILRDANGNPTLVEYKLGDGTVIASGLTWEYFYVRDHFNMVTNYSKYAYDDLLTYMVYLSNTCEHNYELVETVEPTCEENGYTKYVCTLCSHEYMGDIVLPNGHTPSEWIVDVPPLCVPGNQHKECTVCGKILESGEIPPLADHIPSEWIVDVAPTVTQTGIRHKECIVCGAVLETEVMPILAKLVIEDVEAAGKTVRVTIDIQNNSGIVGALLAIEYDPALTLIGAEVGSAWNSLHFTAPKVYSNPSNFVWDGVSGADFSNGTILVLIFEIPQGADVGAIYNISASYMHGNVINEKLEAIDLEIVNGSITVVNEIGDVNDDGIVDVADVIVLRRYLAGGYDVVIDEFAADMDGDGHITVADVVLLRRFLVD